MNKKIKTKDLGEKSLLPLYLRISLYLPRASVSPQDLPVFPIDLLYHLQICPRSLLPLPFSIPLYFLHIPVSSQDLSVFYVDLFVSSIVDFLLSFPDLSRSFTNGKEKLPPLTSTEAK
jgi:hypothetical protein